MSASCHGKEDVSVLAGPHLHTGIGFSILCKVCGGKMLMVEELLGKAKQARQSTCADEESLGTGKSSKCFVYSLWWSMILSLNGF